LRLKTAGKINFLSSKMICEDVDEIDIGGTRKKDSSSTFGNSSRMQSGRTSKRLSISMPGSL